MKKNNLFEISIICLFILGMTSCSEGKSIMFIEDLSILLSVIAVCNWVCLLVDILMNEFKNSSDKIVWLLITLFFPILLFILNQSNVIILDAIILIVIALWLYSIFYYIVGKKQQIKKQKE